MRKSFIVTFKTGTNSTVIDKAISDLEKAGGTLGHRYDSSLLGFSASLPDDQLSTLEAHPDVEAIEGDGHVYAYS
ncbi:hypothetical protein HDU91_007075, partial [Kappamyces sp. JEL0680]